MVWISLFQFRSLEILPDTSTKDQFSAERGMKYLEQIAIKPRPLGSEEHDRVRDYLIGTLTELGFPPEIQKAEGLHLGPSSLYEGEIENIIVRIPGEDSSGAILVSSHYDSVTNSPGASDAGASVAAILETVRALSHGSKLKNDVIFLITDGEESGLLGAQLFVKQHPWAKDVEIVFNFEARGNRGPSVLFETNEGNDRLISEYVKAVPNPVAHSFIYELYKYMPNDTDLTVFKQGGMYGLNFAFFDGMNAYHSPNDTINNLSINSLQHHGENMLRLVQHFGNLNLVSIDEGNRIFFNIIGKKVVTYSEKLVVPLTIIVLFCYAFTFIYGSKLKKVNLKGTIAGFLLFIVLIILSYYAGLGFWKLINRIFLERITLISTKIEWSDLLFGCIVFLYFVLMTFCYQLASKKISIFNLTMGAYLGWLSLLVISSILFKSSSYIFLVPSFYSLIGLNLLLKFRSEQKLKGSVITIIFAIPGLLITVPVVYITYVLLTLKDLNFLLPLTALIVTLFIPFLINFKVHLPHRYKFFYN